MIAVHERGYGVSYEEFREKIVKLQHDLEELEMKLEKLAKFVREHHHDVIITSDTFDEHYAETSKPKLRK